MPRYGVYLIPSADHPLFRLGSDFLGYNIWAESHSTPLLADTLGEETVRAWIGNAKHFSFHITIADCLEYRAEDVDEIRTRIQWIAQRMAPFTLTDGRFYDDFHSGHALTLTYKSPDQALQRLHRLVVTLLWSPARKARRAFTAEFDPLRSALGIGAVLAPLVIGHQCAQCRRVATSTRRNSPCHRFVADAGDTVFHGRFDSACGIKRRWILQDRGIVSICRRTQTPVPSMEFT